MLPYFLVLPLWLLVAVLLPLAQSLHAVQTHSEDRKTWLFYWVCFTAASSVLVYFEWLIQIPFFVFAFYADLYYEAQLGLAMWLVLPRFLGIKIVQAHFESNAVTLSKMGMDLVRKRAAELREAFMSSEKQG
mmetsp:Transcript_23719/g.68224  ORF Transcript_23719/g.68224 Transcript_23719/m.68224 type:complete len:132 (+) Transcript_23719:98-493(+)